MESDAIENLRRSIIGHESALGEIMQNEIVTNDIEIKRMVGSISAEFAGFLELKLVPKLKSKFPGFEDN